MATQSWVRPCVDMRVCVCVRVLGQMLVLQWVQDACSRAPTAALHAHPRAPPAGRCLLTLMTSAGGVPLVVATSHLESPCPPQGMFSAERQQQMAEALRVLDATPAGNVIFAGGR